MSVHVFTDVQAAYPPLIQSRIMQRGRAEVITQDRLLCVALAHHLKFNPNINVVC